MLGAQIRFHFYQPTVLCGRYVTLSAVAIGTTGKLTGQNEIECTDGAGNVEALTSRNFIIAVGGRPTPLECIGGELAISSDDLFSMVKEVSHLQYHTSSV